MKIRCILSIILIGGISSSFAQVINKQTISSDNQTPLVGCASHELLLRLDDLNPGTLKKSNDYLKEVNADFQLAHSRATNEVYRIPVVFHVLYNNATENIPDSVFIQQMEILNNAYRRQNTDTVNMRPDFIDVVGDSKIEFYLATTDPNGGVTNGIIHKQTQVTNFGGVLPYGASQQAQIQQWVNDSLFYNYFSLTKDSLGGDDAWDTARYLNVWVGDLTILEPQFNNVEELVFFGLSTPPIAHANWPAATMQQFAGLGDGTLMHYKAIGPNNPAPFVGTYSGYNGIANTGKMLVHEVGHYLGLRHIWGDGACAEDDYVSDTPRANAASQYNCIKSTNSCVDTINGVDLPNMVENYMDYSAGNCQNSFTNGQAAVMRATIENFRDSVIVNSVQDTDFANEDMKLFPNPTSDNVRLEFREVLDKCTIQVLGLTGVVMNEIHLTHVKSTQVILPAVSGVYFIRVSSHSKMMTFKVVKR